MKLFYVFVLFVVTIAIGYVYGGDSSDSDKSTELDELDTHHCDPLAVNTTKDLKRTGADSMNQVLPIKAFLQYNKAHYYVARATPTPNSTTLEHDTAKPKFCHVPFFGRGCGPLHHYHEFSEVYDPKRRQGLKGIRLRTIFVGMNLENGKAIEYNIEIQGVNKDDYIFRWVENTPITVYEIEDNGDKKEIPDIPKTVLERLKSEFALYRIGVTPSTEWIPSDEDRSENEDDEVESETKEEDFDNRARLYLIYISCDGNSIWAAYDKSVVDVDQEASQAQIIDEYVQELQDSAVALLTTEELEHPRPLVKPVSTYMPIRFDQLVLNAQNMSLS